MEEIKLTQYSHGAGCGCKIAPSVLEEMLSASGRSELSDERLIVGNETNDDAAVYDIGNGMGVISTTDFFMPIVDDPLDFGRIAAVNALSDVYAMGGTPLMAIAVLGWPIDKLPAETAGQVLEGGRMACAEAGIALAGGHSIDNPEPIFGLAVTGTVALKNLKKNSTANPGCVLYLTKPLGVGILSTAQKKGKLREQHQHIARDSMVRLNDIGTAIAEMPAVKAMTDVTGFGLLGHLCEMCEGSGVNAKINIEAVPKIKEIEEYIDMECIPGGTNRNWASYGGKIAELSERQRQVLCDPQTSGGLLVAVDPEGEKEFTEVIRRSGYELESIGTIEERKSDGPFITFA